ncbi:ATP-binding protein [Niallia sp. 01092]|uniref:ATP-binding protein n=1 Tax=unclassified Niallia TaxID=2837522 RepID=UPI003FD33406
MNNHTEQRSKKQLIDYNARKGHILYIYEDISKYMENTVDFILQALKNKHQLLLIEKEEVYKEVFDTLTNLVPPNELESIYFLTDQCFLQLCDGTSFESLQAYFKQTFNKGKWEEKKVDSWIHISMNEHTRPSYNLNQIGRILTEKDSVGESNAVFALNGEEVSATYQNKLVTAYPYFMTDDQIIESLFYMHANNPSFTVYKEKQELESIIKATRHQLESFIMRNLDPIVILNNKDIVLTVNEAFEKTFGWKPQEIVGVNSLHLPHIPKSEMEEVYQNRCKTFIGENVEEYESIRVNKEGNQLYVLISCLPLRDEYDKVNGRAVIIRDITEKKQAQELLVKAEKLSIAGELAAGIAHEIRNPVTAIKGFLQLMEQAEEKNKVYYEIMEAEIERIELILSELLILSKPQAVHFEWTNIYELIQDTVILLEAEAIMKNVQIDLEIESDKFFINCEKNQIKQVCINFIKNAIEAMKNGGKLTIQLKKTNAQEVLIVFIDEGCGIPDYVLSKLGQPFYTTKEKGTGLGFMVSKKIIENHKGTVSISSQENIGTTIVVKIPLSHS